MVCTIFTALEPFSTISLIKLLFQKEAASHRWYRYYCLNIAIAIIYEVYVSTVNTVALNVNMVDRFCKSKTLVGKLVPICELFCYNNIVLVTIPLLL